MGTLTRKTDPHQNRARSKPPAMGPIAIPSPMMPPQAPMARARGLGSRKTSLTMDSDDGIVRAAPTPIRALEGIRRSTEPEKAAAIDPAPKTARPRRKNFLRPKRSAMLPLTSKSPAKTMA